MGEDIPLGVSCHSLLEQLNLVVVAGDASRRPRGTEQGSGQTRTATEVVTAFLYSRAKVLLLERLPSLLRAVDWTDLTLSK